MSGVCSSPISGEFHIGFSVIVRDIRVSGRQAPFYGVLSVIVILGRNPVRGLSRWKERHLG